MEVSILYTLNDLGSSGSGPPPPTTIGRGFVWKLVYCIPLMTGGTVDLVLSLLLLTGALYGS